MNKPQMKREVGIVQVNREKNTVAFRASKDIAQELAQFGTLFAAFSNPDMYSLIVDRRYDFDEVLSYIQDLTAPLPPVDSVWTED